MSRTWGVKCVIPSCGRTKRDFPFSKFFKFPCIGTKAHLIWMKLCGLEISPSAKNAYVCGIHFKSKYVGKKYLKRNAIPTLNLNTKLVGQRYRNNLKTSLDDTETHGLCDAIPNKGNQSTLGTFGTIMEDESDFRHDTVNILNKVNDSSSAPTILVKDELGITRDLQVTSDPGPCKSPDCDFRNEFKVEPAELPPEEECQDIRLTDDNLSEQPPNDGISLEVTETFPKQHSSPNARASVNDNILERTTEPNDSIFPDNDDNPPKDDNSQPLTNENGSEINGKIVHEALQVVKTALNALTGHDQFSAYGDHVAHKLRSCQRNNSEIYIAQNNIDQILFKLSMGFYDKDDQDP